MMILSGSALMPGRVEIDMKKYFILETAKRKFLNNFTVYAIHKDRNKICIALHRVFYKPDSDELFYPIPTYDDKSGEYTKMYNQSLCLYESDEVFWVGASGGGLLKFIPGKGIIKRYTEQEGLSNNVIYGILPDKSGNLWLSTNNGISKFNIEDETFIYYFMSDGLPSDEFNVGACLKSSSGKLYFEALGIDPFLKKLKTILIYRPWLLRASKYSTSCI
jgi:hypothetical protein